MLAAGDTLLLRGTWAALDENLDDPAVLVVDPPELVRRQAVPLGLGAKAALAVLAVMVVLLATGAVPPAVAGLLAAGAMILLRVLSIEQAQRGISWTTVVLVGGHDPALDGDGGVGRRRAARRPGSSTSSAMPARTSCCSGSSCSPRCSAS